MSRLTFLLAACCLITVAGCERPSPDTPPTPRVTTSPLPVTAQRPISDPPQREFWEACYIQNSKMGYVHTTETDVIEKGARLRLTTAEHLLRFVRAGRPAVTRFETKSWETPDGDLVRFSSVSDMGNSTTTSVGRLEGSELIVETTQAGKTISQRIPWSNDYAGVFAVEQSLREEPLKPGERRTLHTLLPVLNIVAPTELVATGYEPAELLDGTRELLRIESAVTPPGQPTLQNVLWTDSKGSILKARQSLEMTLYRTTEEVAKRENAGPAYDIAAKTIVPLAQPIPDMFAAKMAFRVELGDANPADVLANTGWQQVTSAGPRVANVIVHSSLKGAQQTSEPPIFLSDPPVPADLAASQQIQSDDPSIVALANEAVAGEVDPQEIAQRLEQFVFNRVTAKGYSQVFASASEVAKNWEGDCTEHSVLLAALARTQKIPARVAIGLLYVPESNGFAYHMWNELYVNGAWRPYDATLGQGGASAARLCLARSNLSNETGLSGLLVVAKVMGQMKIELADAKVNASAAATGPAPFGP